jgi:pimeloyl-ACP methyl ester carboxylesterase
VISSLDGVPLAHRHAHIGEISLHYVEAGEGPLVVLLHGFPEFWYSWRHQIPALVRAGFRVIAPDLRGYNDSSKPKSVDAYRVIAVIQDIAGLIVQSGDVPCTLVGHDWGGVAGWFLPMLHPELVDKLIIVNAPHPVPLARELRRSKEQKVRMLYQVAMQPPRIPEFLLRRFRFTLLRGILGRMGNFDAKELNEYIEAWKKPGALTAMTNYYRALRRHRRELRPLVRPIDIPTLLIWGEQDPVFTHATTENFHDYVPNLRTERITDAGHFVQSEAPDRVNRAMIAFLKG